MSGESNVMAWQDLLARRRSRFWHDKAAIDLLVDFFEPDSWPIVKFFLLSRLALRGSQADARPPAGDSATQPEPCLPRSEPAKTEMDVVPRLIFQTWKVRHPLPANYQYWSKSFAAQNPGHQHIIWDDADNREFIATRFPWFLPYYDRYPREIFRVDLVRMFFLYEFGGLYVDMDTQCLRPVDEALRTGDVILGWMGREAGFAHAISNAIMASKPKQLFWLLAIANAIDRAALCRGPADFIARPEFLTACILIRDSYLEYVSHTEWEIRARLERSLPKSVPVNDAVAGEVRVLPAGIWYPINWNNLWHQRFRRELLRKNILLTQAQARALFPAAHLVTYWTHSW